MLFLFASLHTSHVCVRVYTTPSPAHVYCPNARFSHKVRLKIDWKFLVRLLKCLSLTANKMAAKNNKKSQKQKSNKQRSSNIAPVATAEQRMRKGKREKVWGRGPADASTQARHAGCGVSFISSCAYCPPPVARGQFLLCASVCLVSLSLSLFSQQVW